MTKQSPKTDTDTTIRKSVFLAAPREKVWSFLTRADKLGQWFHPAAADLSLGQPYTLNNGLDGDRMCWGTVQDMRAPEYMKWSFTVGPMQDAMTTVEWQLDEVPGGTRLSLTHSGLPTDGDGFGLVLALDQGWHGFIGNLHDLTRAEGSGDYVATIVVPAPPDTARRAILYEMHIWWTNRVEKTDTGVTVRFNNSHASFEFAEGDSPNALNWTCTDANMIIDDIADTTEWTGTRLLWRITPAGSGSRITMIHEGSNEGLACQDVCNRGWERFFEISLKAHLSGEKPTPETS